MPFLDTNSHLTTKPYNFDIKCQSNSESYNRHNFCGTKIRGGQNLLLMVEGFFNEREYSGADWLVPFLRPILARANPSPPPGPLRLQLAREAAAHQEAQDQGAQGAAGRGDLGAVARLHRSLVLQ